MQKAIYSANTGFNLFNYRISGMQLLASKGWSVVAIANDEADFKEKFKRRGFRYIPIQIDDKGQNPLKDMLYFSKLLSIYRKERPALVHHFSSKPVIFGSLAAKATRIPAVINTVAGIGYPLVKGGLLTFITKALLKLGCQGRPQTIFQNNFDLDYFTRNKIVNPTNTHIIPGSGIDTNLVRPGNNDDSNNRMQFALIARMLWTKGIKEFVDAAAEIKQVAPHAYFVMAGGASVAGAKPNPEAIPEQWLIKIHRAGPVKWIGPKPFLDILQLLDRSQVVVLPTYHPEGVPRSLIEAAAKGKPIITTDIPGCRDVVFDGVNGFLIPSKDRHRLKQKMLKFIEHPELIKTMGTASRKIAKDKFDVRSFLEKTEYVYREATVFRYP
jgi:glycosyltransferase involved in cell wall biosynthesis